MRPLTSVVLSVGLLSLLAMPLAAQESGEAATPAPIEESAGITTTSDPPEERARAMVTRWQDLLTELEDAAREADLDTLEAKYPGFMEEISVHVATGHEELIARAFRIMASIEVLQSRSEPPPDSPSPHFGATHTLQLARQLWPPIADGLDAFGELSEPLEQASQEAEHEAKELRERAAQMRADRNFVPPNLQGSREFRYPPAAKAAGLEAVVRVRYLIDEDGVPVFPEVLDHDVPSSLLTAALEAILASRFEPAMVGSRLVPAEDTVTVRFARPQ